jgi:hypothetical protein
LTGLQLSIDIIPPFLPTIEEMVYLHLLEAEEDILLYLIKLILNRLATGILIF